MELKQETFMKEYNRPDLLIVPYGIETYQMPNILCLW